MMTTLISQAYLAVLPVTIKIVSIMGYGALLGIGFWIAKCIYTWLENLMSNAKVDRILADKQYMAQLLDEFSGAFR